MVGSFSVLLNLMRDRQRDLFYVPMNRYIWLYAGIYLVGTFFSVNLKGSLLGGMLTVAFVLFTIMLENAVTTRRQLDVLIAMMVLAGTVVALYGILQYLFGWGYQSTAWVDTDMFGDSFRVPSTLENPNMLGQYLILAIPLGGAGLLSAKDWAQRVWYFICCGIMCVCMLLTLSRGAAGWLLLRSSLSCFCSPGCCCWPPLPWWPCTLYCRIPLSTASPASVIWETVPPRTACTFGSAPWPC